MRLTFSNKAVAVFDEVLSSDELRLFWSYVQNEEYRYIQSGAWSKIFKIGDGNSLEGPAYTSEAVFDVKKVKAYPTGLGVDLLISQIKSVTAEVEPWIGKDWDYFSAKPYLYPRGTGLAWHDDFTDVSGAYIFYGHPEWKVSWGGELLVADEEPRTELLSKTPLYQDETGKILGYHLDDSAQGERILNPGVGFYIFPKPNRLAFIKRGVSHAIKRVEADTGDHVRCSISGFFMRRK